jgi:peptidoglycan/LPS O-acetylase OafA/YrhL
MQNERFYGLDGLRGIAAIAIAVLHMSEYSLKFKILNAGWAVDFFFLLSGFVLATAYPKPGASYLGERLIRLYPAYLFGLVLGVVLLSPEQLHVTPFTYAGAAIMNVFMLPAWVFDPRYPYPFDLPLWSIYWEMWASLAYFLAARWMTPLRLALFAAALGALWLLIRPGDMPTIGWGAFARTFIPFSLGVMFRRAWPGVRLDERWGFAAACALIVFLFFPFPIGNELITLVVLGGVLCLGAASQLSVLKAPAVYLGRLSYPLYVVHWPLAWWFGWRHLTGLGWMAVTFFVSWIVAHLCLVFYEEPVRRWLRAAAFRRKPSLSPA